MQLPADGVYACWYHRIDGTRIKAAVNVGKRPTFYADNERSLVEAHLIHFRGDLYGEPARLTFSRRLRPERKFEHIDDLKRQLDLDVGAAAASLSLSERGQTTERTESLQPVDDR
jgi:riboflavin kinase/FMN adenylyltransferase